MEKTLGKCFRTTKESFTGSVRIFGSWYDYRVVAGLPAVGDMLEVIDYTPNALLVKVNNTLYESDVTYIGNF